MKKSQSQQQRFAQKDFQYKVVLAVLLIIFAWILVEYTSLLYRSYQVEQKKQWFIEENDRLISNNQDLEKRYEYYKTDYFFRKEAKRKLNKKEPGEKVIVVTGGDERIFSENDWEIREDNIDKWKDYFFGEEEVELPSYLSS